MEEIEATPNPSPPSFAIRGETPHLNNFLRSLSLKEDSFYSEEPPAASLLTPPRLSSPSISSSSCYHVSNSQPSSPCHVLSSNNGTTYTYRCISSVLKKNGQILSMATSNGLLYTGSQTNVVRIWKLPEFSECGQLKSKAKMVVALEVSNDRVYAAYADCKIRVWCRRTWEGVTKHVRLATIPKTGSYVRTYISGKDKMVMLLV